MQQSLRLISLSNYVFVLEISQISGIVQNVSMLIMVVMRIVAVVGEEKRKGSGREGVSLEPKALCGPNLFYQTQVFCSRPASPRNSQGKCCVKHCAPPPPFLPVQGCSYLWQITKRSPLISPPRASAASVSQHQGRKCLTWRYFLIFPPC